MVVPPQTSKLAEIRVLQPVSVIVPTFRESENIPLLLERLNALRKSAGLELEVLFMDDESQDGSAEVVAASGFDWARIIVRTKEHGLSLAVIDGMRCARNPILVCMDCDLSHPPERIPDMILALSSGQQMVIGSRYVPGGTTDHDWGFYRYLNSLIATLLAKPLTSVRDPMSGFFALRRDDFLRARDLNPIGYKIALELIVKAGLDNVGEVPIHFSDRQHGESKLTILERIKYIQHLRRLYLYKFTNIMNVFQFLVVGAIGTLINICVLSILYRLGAGKSFALIGGISISVISNFLLNRRFTFSYARSGNIWHQFAGFISASAIGLAINYAVAIMLASGPLASASYGLQLSALLGIGCGMAFNYLGNRFVVFRRRHIVAPDQHGN